MSNIPFSTHFQAWDDYGPTPQSSGDGYSAFCTSPTSTATSIDDVNDFQLSAEHDMQKAASVDPYTGLGGEFRLFNRNLHQVLTMWIHDRFFLDGERIHIAVSNGSLLDLAGGYNCERCCRFSWLVPRLNHPGRPFTDPGGPGPNAPAVAR
jgi:hypothetical protein